MGAAFAIFLIAVFGVLCVALLLLNSDVKRLESRIGRAPSLWYYDSNGRHAVGYDVHLDTAVHLILEHLGLSFEHQDKTKLVKKKTKSGT